MVVVFIFVEYFGSVVVLAHAHLLEVLEEVLVARLVIMADAAVSDELVEFIGGAQVVMRLLPDCGSLSHRKPAIRRRTASFMTRSHRRAEVAILDIDNIVLYARTRVLAIIQIPPRDDIEPIILRHQVVVVLLQQQLVLALNHERRDARRDVVRVPLLLQRLLVHDGVERPLGFKVLIQQVELVVLAGVLTLRLLAIDGIEFWASESRSFSERL